MNRAVLIAVTHLLGAGHLTRAAALGRALAQVGHSVTLVSGGMPAPLIATDGLHVVQLPPLRATNEDFSVLSDRDGRPPTAEYLARRRDVTLRTVEAARPDILLTELYPFGRRMLAAEFDALLDAAAAQRPRPLVVASVRDILVTPTRPERLDRTHSILRERYDAVLVHGDRDFVTLDESWPLPGELTAKLHYTGFIDADPRGDGAGDECDILVSGGSSEGGLPLYRAALDAAGQCRSRHFRVLVGHAVSETCFRHLVDKAPANAVVERARPNFRALLARARLLVGLAGYNTAVDLFATGTPAVLVPYEQRSETEQRLRAARMAAWGSAVVLPEAQLSATTLGRAIEESATQPRRRRVPRLDGVARSVRILTQLRDAQERAD